VQERFETLGKTLKEIFAKAIDEQVFSGAGVGVCLGPPESRQQLTFSFGSTSFGEDCRPVDENTFFDLASLTKPLATTLATLCLFKERKISLSTTLPKLLQQDTPEEKASITVERLLNHCSGLPAHRPYYLELRKLARHKRKARLLQAVLDEPLESAVGEKNVYSDLGFVLLGWGIEKHAEKGLERFFEEKIVAPLGLAETLFFQPLCTISGTKAWAI